MKIYSGFVYGIAKIQNLKDDYFHWRRNLSLLKETNEKVEKDFWNHADHHHLLNNKNTKKKTCCSTFSQMYFSRKGVARYIDDDDDDDDEEQILPHMHFCTRLYLVVACIFTLYVHVLVVIVYTRKLTTIFLVTNIFFQYIIYCSKSHCALHSINFQCVLITTRVYIFARS